MSRYRSPRRMKATSGMFFRSADSPSARLRILAVIIAALIVIQAFVLSHPRVGAQVSTVTLGVPYMQNFDTLPASGSATWTNNSTIPGWFHARTGTGTTIVANDGSSNAGNLYSYGTGTATDRALGSLGSGNAAIGNLFWGVRLQNNSGSTITQLDVSYTGEQWRNSAAAAQTVSFSYLIGSPTVTGSLAEFQSASGVVVPQLNFTSPITGGTAGALNGNLAANRVTLTHSITGLNIPNGTEVMLRWSDPDHTGADHGLSIDDFSVTPQGSGPTDSAPTVSSTNPADDATGVSISSNVSVTFSEAVSAPDGAFTINCASSGAHSFVSSTSDNITFTLNPDSNFSSNELCTVTVDDAQVTDTDTDDPPNNMTADYIFDFTTVDLSTCGTTFTPIYTIQGSGTASPLDGTTVTTEGIVTASFLSTGINGYYIQDPTGDGNMATSDGIFVFDGSFNASLAVGDRVRVSGTVDEFFDLTEITTVTSVLVCSTGNLPPTATIYDLPEPNNDDLERVENMLVTFQETLTVSGNFTLGRFGELVLSSDGRMFHQNGFNAPGSAGSTAAANLNLRRYVVLDDGDTAQNPDPTPYFDAVPTRRLGDTVTGLTGILTYGFDEYRVQPIPTAPPVFVSANPRPAAHDPVGGNLEVASFNVLNYFNGDGAGGGFPTSRGADDATEFTRQRNKIIAAMVAIDADVFGVIEIENDGNGSTSAIQDLVNGLNAIAGAGTYAFTEGTTPGTDEIKNSIIYKPASVTPVGAAVNDVDSVWNQARNPLAQTFSHNGNSEVFTFIVNHFTSKGCSSSDTGGDADTGDGQGCDVLQRTLQANRLLTFVQARKTASGDNDVLVMGDLNAESEEPPVTILEQDSGDVLGDGPGGLVNQIEKFVPASSRYSLQFDSRSNMLDHALTTKELNPFVSGTTIWHINADEPTVLDYNLEFKSASQQAINVGTPYKSSDHDPVIVGLNLTNVQPPAAGQVIISEFRFRGPGFISGPPEAGLSHKIAMPAIKMPTIVGPTNQAEDEFIEIYNNTNSDITVTTTDGSAGWALVAADGVTRFIIPNNTVIPARGHFLGVNTDGYSLANYGGGGAAAGDSVLLADGVTPASGYTQDIPDGSGIALFRSANSANFTLAERLDAAGYTGVPELYREGTGFPTGGAETTGGLEYTFFRSMTRATGGLPKDTGDNTADFFLADTAGTDFDPGAGTTRRLGAPGPENLSSPINRTLQFGYALLDPSVSAEAVPNRERSATAVSNGDFGTLTIRRRFTNNTGGPVSRLRFRLVEVTTLTSPSGSGFAQLRALTSSDEEISTPGRGIVVVRGTTLEQPPFQSMGGGWNATLNVANIGGSEPAALTGKVLFDTATTGTILLAAPLNDGESVDAQFKLGVMQTGRFFFYVNIEATVGPVLSP